MDRTAIIVLALCAVLFGWWVFEEKKIAEAQARTEAANRAAQLAAAVAAPAPAATPGGTTGGLSAPSPQAVLPLATNLPEQVVVVTNAYARYTFTSRLGGLARVDLLSFPETISQRWKPTKTKGDSVASLNTRAPFPVLAVLGDADVTGDGQFTLTRSGSTVRAQKRLSNGLVLTKQFVVGTNYILDTTVRLDNPSGQAITVGAHEIVTGTATPMDVDDNGMNEGVMWYNGNKAAATTLSSFSGSGFGCSRGAPLTEILGGSNNVVWLASHNQYFALLAMPQEPAPQFVATPLSLPAFANVQLAAGTPPPRGIQAALVYPGQTLTAGSSVERHITFFAGPKEYRTLSDIGMARSNHADLAMNFGSYLGLDLSFFAKVLLLAMNKLHDWTNIDYGWIIVLITVIIKVVFWPLTAASTRSMKRMQAIGPELKALQEKYKEEPQKLTSKQWELYKKHNVNPLSGCLPMLVQMPVFFGFFTMIRTAIELRGAHFLWVPDLSKPDTLFMIPGIDFPFNLLPLLMGGAMLWQAHLTPPSPGMDASQQKIMRYMPLIFLVFLYNFSAGMALYWTVNNLLTILQTKLTRNLKDPAAPTTPAAPAGPARNPALTPAAKLKK